jgi:hypothetical protein
LRAVVVEFANTTQDGAGAYNQGVLVMNNNLQPGLSIANAFAFNTTTGNGGGVFTANGATTTMLADAAAGVGAILRLTGNSATNGGNFYVESGGVLNVGNSASHIEIDLGTAVRGAGYYIDNGGEANLGCTVHTRFSPGDPNPPHAVEGGGVYNAGTFTQLGGTFDRNSADVGGGLFNAPSGLARFGQVGVCSVNFDANVASGTPTSNGGDIYNQGQIIIESAIHSNNFGWSGTVNGGGLYQEGLTASTLIVGGGYHSFSGEDTSGDGGGFYFKTVQPMGVAAL